ncbi:MAG TPA: helicase-exonuclease AddAB subunit AddA [Clostridiales bacterium]|nr:MAG: ATP-dependent helicase/nuclease subunit A [Firmicutes bacterium ADurb.Bin262]HOU10917.1 helicase-exonuclease AddAB subunit AddA [Clostridiales bacterium]
MEWTNQQLRAIESTGGTVLVSAAAGSGKTSVLVERVIRRITQGEKRCDIDRLLIVTFTRAAAAQVREKIAGQLSALLAQHPGDGHLLRQQMLLPFADICTIDSYFCKLVREHFHLLDINPDFRMLDESEKDIMRVEAARAVIDRLHQEGSGEIAHLAELLIESNDDSRLLKVVIDLYEQAQSHRFPRQWLLDLAKPYEETGPLEKTACGQFLLAQAAEALEYLIGASRALTEYAADYPGLAGPFAETFNGDILIYESLSAILKDSGWDEAAAAVASANYGRMKNTPKDCDGSAKEYLKNAREKLKEIFRKNVAGTFFVDSASHAADAARLKPVAQKLIEATLLFGEEYARLKNEANAADFSDVNHLALNLLVAEDGLGNHVKTPLAEELSLRYEEILVDEYQDINKAQDDFFEAVSKDRNNLFMVGDVKQSIYRFRQAMPEIFLSRRDSLPEFDGVSYPAKVLLGGNFRSRPGITGAVNFFFRRLMSAGAGELDYTEDEYLVPEADYPPGDGPDAEIHLLTVSKDNKTGDEAAYIARWIKSMVDGGAQVCTKTGTRPARFSDFCVLIRSPKSKAAVYIDTFDRCLVPATSDLTDGFFEARETVFMLSLMRVIDNPSQDIPLLSVMLSPVFGFTPDDLARLRLLDKECALYRCVVAAAEKGDRKFAGFLDSIAAMRRLSLTMTAGSLVRRLLDFTGFMAIAGAMGHPERRKANLYLLIELADRYEQAGHIGTAGFIRQMDRLAEENASLPEASEHGGAANAVTVMSIHKSKGLEFPFCILADCSKQFNKTDLSQAVAVNPSLGIGLSYRDAEQFTLYDTVFNQACGLDNYKRSISEEMRILYVAMTRAREKFIAVISGENPGGGLAKLCAGLGSGTPLHPFAVRKMNSFADWLLAAAVSHPNAQTLRRMASLSEAAAIPDRSPLAIVEASASVPAAEEQPAVERPAPDEAVLERIRRKLSSVYPYAELAAIPAKRAASEAAAGCVDRVFFASRAPSFLAPKGLSPAEQGSALHAFMQFADYALARQDPEAESERLVLAGHLTRAQREALDLEKIAVFFASPLAGRIFASPQVMTEKKFTLAVPARELYAQLSPVCAGENVVVQGVIDCLFAEGDKLVVVDYKTDRGVTPELLRERYRGQLSIYARAAAECFALPVKEVLLYSFWLGEQVELAAGESDE